MVDTVDVVVVGGGVVGASVAYFTSKAGISCTLIERGVVGGGASNAASGELSQFPGDSQYARLGQRSMDLFHQLAPVLEEESGVDIELARCGELALALDKGDVIALQGHARRVSALGGDATWVDSVDLLEMEPNLNQALLGAVYQSVVSRVNNQRLSDALALSAAAYGADVRQGTEVIGLVRESGRVTGLMTTAGSVSADRVVLAAGAWTGSMDRWLYGDRSPSAIREPMVKPVRGVNLNLRPRHGSITSVIHGSWGILVPRNDGSMIVGATVEEVGFDARVTAGDVHGILGIGTALVPTLQDADLNWAVAGLRPGSGDDLPVIGRLPDYENVIVASGHFRTGILLSLATGEAVLGLLNGTAENSLSAFDPARFF